MDERVQPHSIEAEQAVLGAILLNEERFDQAAAVLERGHFFRDAHRRVWAMVQRLREAKAVADLVTVTEALKNAGELDEVGGAMYLSGLIDVGRGANVEGYARIVRQHAGRRHLIAAADSILTEAYAADVEVELLMDRAERTVMDLGRQVSTSRGEFVLAEDWMRETYALVERAAQLKRVVTGVPTGLASLDRMTRGLQGSDLIYVGARPSTGKTALALQLAIEASRHVMTGFVSVEMSRAQMGIRAVALEGRVDAYRMMTGALSDREQQQAGAAITRLAERRIAIDDASGQTSAGLRAKVRRLASRYGLGIVFIDYMQLLHDSTRAENRNQELSAISAGLKDLAKELQVPVVVLSQLARKSEESGNRRPQLWHLRDSGSLEADADVVMLLHRPGQHSDGDRYRDGEQAELIVAKQRNGPTGLIELQWVADQMRFAERERDSEAPVAEQPAFQGVR